MVSCIGHCTDANTVTRTLTRCDEEAIRKIGEGCRIYGPEQPWRSGVAAGGATALQPPADDDHRAAGASPRISSAAFVLTPEFFQ